MLTAGKYRHLAQNSTAAGHFNILALDHRANLAGMLAKQQSEAVTEADIVAFKRDVFQALLPEASALLADPLYGIAPAFEGGLLGQRGLLAPLEVTDYTLQPRERLTRWIEGWSLAKLKRLGGTGVKLLLYYHPDDALAAEKRQTVAAVVAQCSEHDIPLFLEPIAYPLDAAQPLSNSELRRVVVESAATFAQMGVDVLKVEFPVEAKHEPDEGVWMDACRELNAACGDVPWALLSAGVDYATFRRQAVIACQAGASGVIAGRAVWGEAVALRGAARTEFLQTTGVERLRDLGKICAAYGRDWRGRVTPPDLSSGWYLGY